MLYVYIIDMYIYIYTLMCIYVYIYIYICNYFFRWFKEPTNDWRLDQSAVTSDSLWLKTLAAPGAAALGDVSAGRPTLEDSRGFTLWL